MRTPDTQSCRVVTHATDCAAKINRDRISIGGRAKRQMLAVVGQARDHRIALHPFVCLLYEIGERGQCNELPGSEVIAKSSKTITTPLGIACPRPPARSIWFPRR